MIRASAISASASVSKGESFSDSAPSPAAIRRHLDNIPAQEPAAPALMVQLAVTPFFRPYRDDPRFTALCQKLNVQLPATSAKP